MERLEHRPSPHAPWFVLIYETAGHQTQQAILWRFAELGPAGITVLGASDGRRHFIVADCPGLREQTLIGRTIVAADPSARLMHATGSRVPQRDLRALRQAPR